MNYDSNPLTGQEVVEWGISNSIEQPAKPFLY